MHLIKSIIQDSKTPLFPLSLSLLQTHPSLSLSIPNTAREVACPRTQSSLHLADRGHLLVSHVAKGALSASPLLDGGGRALVGGGVEGDEEEEVRGEDADSGDSGEFFTGAGAVIGHIVEVGAGEVGV